MNFTFKNGKENKKKKKKKKKKKEKCEKGNEENERDVKWIFMASSWNVGHRRSISLRRLLRLIIIKDWYSLKATWIAL